MTKKLLAELIGTFALTFAVLVSINSHFPIATPLIAGLTLGLFVYSLTSVSGAHFNPAVTIGIWTLRKISSREAIGYIITQFLGAGLACLLAGALFKETFDLVASNSWQVGLAELIGAFFFMFGIAAVIYGKVPSSLSGLVIGGSLVLGISIAASFSNGVLNPAVAFGIGSFSWMYVLAPIVGSILGMQTYRAISEA